MAFKDTLTNENSDIIADICAGGSKRNSALKFLYTNEKVKGSLVNFVSRYKGDENDVRHILQESIITFDRTVRDGKYRADSKWDTYLIGICKYTCQNYMRSRKDWKELDDLDKDDISSQVADAADAQVQRNELSNTLSQLLDELKPLCKEVLTLWTQNYSMQKIASVTKLSNAATARKRKYRCMKNLMQLIKNRPDLGQYLKEAWKIIN